MSQGERTQEGRPDSAVVDAAASWFVRLSSGVASAEELTRFEHWRSAHADHALAWSRFEQLQQALQSGAVPASVTVSTLRTARRRLQDRRRILTSMVAIGAVSLPALYFVRQTSSVQQAFADVRTVTGERRTLTLSDGTRLWLSTDSAVDLQFDARERRLLLRSGEIHIATAPDSRGRPLVVTTPDGSLRPVGTRFSVRRYQDETFTRLRVSEGAVDVQPRDSMSVLRIDAGQSVQFDPAQISATVPASETEDAWVEGMLGAERMRLADFLTELGRHRRGLLRCDPAVADLRLTGTFPLADTDRILAKLEETLPVRVQYRTRFWVTVVAR